MDSFAGGGGKNLIEIKQMGDNLSTFSTNA